MSSNILKSFDKLKNRKINVENLVNGLTAIVELKRIYPLLKLSLDK